MPFRLSRFIEDECLVISTALKCDQPPRVLLPGYMEGSKPVILLYFPWGHLLWHNTSAFILKELILSDMICDSGCWDGHWDIVSATSPCSFTSTTLMSKSRDFCSSQSLSSLSTPHFLSHTVLKIKAFPHPKVQSFSAQDISFLRLALLSPSAPYLCSPLIDSLIFLPHACQSPSSFSSLFIFNQQMSI